ncbi:MAG: cobalt/nickel transport protein [Actinomycetota bacterium]|nr:cobalt/nickel transport protein [Actinomycetota bacterium]
MSETLPTTVPADSPAGASRRRWGNLALFLAALALLAFPLVFGLGTVADGQEEPFAGTDSQATTEIQESDPDYTPWFEPWFEPGSGEIESGLFALQAALGAGVLGYVLGSLRTRRRLVGPGRTAHGVGPTAPGRP